MRNKRNYVFWLAGILLCFRLTEAPVTVQAEEIEVYRGEETEETVYLEETEGTYALFGELAADNTYVSLLPVTGENTAVYQATKFYEGVRARLLLSKRGEETGGGLFLRFKVKGERIGTGKVLISSADYVSAKGEWIHGITGPEITVKVLPNPLVVTVSGEQGRNGWYVSPVTVTVEDKDAAEIVYELDGSVQAYTAPFTEGNGSHRLIVRSDDGYGYKKEEIRQFHIDTGKPVIAVEKEEAGWQSADIILTTKVSDSDSGLSMVLTSFSESRDEAGGWSTMEPEAAESSSCLWSSALSMPEDGIWYLHVKAEDVAGNEQTKVYGPYRKDSVAPVIVFENLTEDEIVAESILPEVTVTDERSGIEKIAYFLDGEEWNGEKITGKGRHTFTVAAEDKAGNRTEETVQFTIYEKVRVTCSMGECTVDGCSHENCGYGRAKYSETATCSALVTYRGEPLSGAQTEFYINGEYIGSSMTDENGYAALSLTMELSPQTAELKVAVPQDRERYFLATEESLSFPVVPDEAWLVYTGDYSVRYGETLYFTVKTGEIPDRNTGDITRAELAFTLFKIEDDGSRTLYETAVLSPDADGRAVWEVAAETGLYELSIGFTEGSCYRGKKLVLHPDVYEIQAELDAEGGSLLLDLPHTGIRLKAEFGFLPPSVSVKAELRIPGTGIMLTEHTLTGWNFTREGLVLSGKGRNLKNGEVYTYEITCSFAHMVFLDGLKVSVWQGENQTEEPLYSFEWTAENGTKGR